MTPPFFLSPHPYSTVSLFSSIFPLSSPQTYSPFFNPPLTVVHSIILFLFPDLFYLLPFYFSPLPLVYLLPSSNCSLFILPSLLRSVFSLPFCLPSHSYGRLENVSPTPLSPSLPPQDRCLHILLSHTLFYNLPNICVNSPRSLIPLSPPLSLYPPLPILPNITVCIYSHNIFFTISPTYVWTPHSTR